MESDGETRANAQEGERTSVAAEIAPSSPVPGPDVRRARILIGVNIALAVFVVGFTLFFMIRSERGAGFLLEIPKSIAAPWNPEGQYKSSTRDRHKIVLAILAMAFVLAGKAVPKTRQDIQAPLILGLGFVLLIAFHVQMQYQAVRLLQGKYVQYWNVYHYYLGSKYFDELGYTGLYTYTLRADREMDDKLGVVKRVMDLETLQVVPYDAVLAQSEKSEAFSLARWNQFKGDIKVFHRWIDAGAWSNVLRDHGYNGTPFWNTVGSSLANAFPISKKSPRIFILSIDLILEIAAFVAIGWVFGVPTALASAIFFVLFPGNEYGGTAFHVGGFIRYDWFAATVIAFACWKKKYLGAAAVLLAYATVTRIFPAFLLVGPGIVWIVECVRSRRIEWSFVRMAAIFFLACGIFFAAGACNASGFDAWRQFFADIREHTAKHYLGGKRVGLKHLFTDDLSTRGFAKDPTSRSFEKQRGLYYATTTACFILFVAASIRRNRDDAFLLGYFLIFIIVVLSRYYWALFGMMFLLAETDRSKWRNGLSEALVMVMMVVGMAYRLREGRASANHMYLTTWMLAYFVFLSVSFLLDDAIDWFDARRANARVATANNATAEIPSPEPGPF